MTIRVRFAPSPTGYLHIGGARTALYNYLYAKATGGKFILRVEDTDFERSKREYETHQLDDLRWFGLEWDEGPDKPNPKFAPYRQSERIEIYQKMAKQLVDKDLAYYDFCTEEELEEMKAKAEREGGDPRYQGKWKDPAYKNEALAKIKSGEKPAIRFRVPEKPYILQDKVKGQVEYPVGMVGDFVILRSNGIPVYNFCCVVDDILMEITHVIRGEDHLSNTVRQLMIYEAFNAKLPVFAHVSLLIGSDRQKLSKRHGATSVNLYREEHYLPEAMINYLCLLGWSHPEEKDIFTKEEISSIFNLERFSASPAFYDLVKLKWVNGQHLRKRSNEELLVLIKEEKGSETLDFFHAQDLAWKLAAIGMVKSRMEFIHDFEMHLKEMILDPSLEVTEEAKEVTSWDSTHKIFKVLESKIQTHQEKFISESLLQSWSEEVKKETATKGKPLFMGIRYTLTGKAHGPDLKLLLPLIPLRIIQERLSKVKTSLGL